MIDSFKDFIIDYAEDQCKPIKQELEAEKAKVKIFEKTLMVICQLVYGIKSGKNTTDELFDFINSFLKESAKNKLEWDYLLSNEEKLLKIKEQQKEALDNYMHDYDDVDIVDDTETIVLLPEQE